MRSSASLLLLVLCCGVANAFLPGLTTQLGLRTHTQKSSACALKMAQEDGSVSRRSALFAATAAAVFSAQKAGAEGAAAPAAAPAAAGYVDAERGFSFTPPAGWNKGTATFPGERKCPILSAYATAMDVNLAVVSYSVQPDWTKLGSLGTIDDVSRTILGVSGNLDAEMYNQKEKNLGNGPGYIFDYRIKDKHLLTVFTTQSGEYAGTWLVTLTLQAPVGEWDKNKEVLEQAVKSFSLIKR